MVRESPDSHYLVCDGPVPVAWWRPTLLCVALLAVLVAWALGSPADPRHAARGEASGDVSSRRPGAHALNEDQESTRRSRGIFRAERGSDAGDPISDLMTALDGKSSGLVRLRTTAERQFFRELTSETDRRNGSGLVFFRLDSGREADSDSRSYRVSENGVDVAGVIRMRRIDSRWRVVGAERAGERERQMAATRALLESHFKYE